MADIELRNGTDYKFADISSEQYREYLFSSGEKLRIDGPQWLYVSDSGGHRILDTWGTSHYIAPGWLAISWEVYAEKPHFVA